MKMKEFMENNNLYYEFNFGFRRNKSIIDYFVEMFKIIENSIYEKNQILIMTTNISKAYDNVNKNILINQMKNDHFSEQIIN